MSPRWTTRSLSLIIVGALLACLVFAAETQAQKGKGPEKPHLKGKNDGKPHPKGPGPKEILKQEMNGREAELLRVAYNLLLEANKNYAGHRANALKHIEHAFSRLDHKIMKKGTAQQKARTFLEDSITERRKLIDKYVPKIRERQDVSDLLVQTSGELLGQVVPILQQRKQHQVLEEVHKAQRQLVLALKTR